ncbi:MAG: acyl-CoA dehydrogenase family protein, partial [Chloroflexota bacterium]
GGYSLEGEWPFASGCTHTTWLMGAAAVYGPDGEARRQANGAPDTRMLLVPTFAARIVDTWQVSGLRGTGSHTVAVTGLFVPHDQTASPVRDRRAPAGPLDAIPDGLLFAAGFSAVTMGIARGALDAFIALAAVKKPRDARRVLQEDAVVQTEVAQAEARLRSARAFLHETVREAWEAAVRGEALTDGQQVLLRLAATSGIHQAAQVVDTAYHAAGATAIFASNGFERRFRDVHAVTQQAQAQQHHFQAVGQFFLSLGPDDQ